MRGRVTEEMDGGKAKNASSGGEEQSWSPRPESSARHRAQSVWCWGKSTAQDGRVNEPGEGGTTWLWRGRNGSDASCPEMNKDADLLWKREL